jgi:hypothetical protein
MVVALCYACRVLRGILEAVCQMRSWSEIENQLGVLDWLEMLDEWEAKIFWGSVAVVVAAVVPVVQSMYPLEIGLQQKVRPAMTEWEGLVMDTLGI